MSGKSTLEEDDRNLSFIDILEKEEKASAQLVKSQTKSLNLIQVLIFIQIIIWEGYTGWPKKKPVHFFNANISVAIVAKDLRQKTE